MVVNRIRPRFRLELPLPPAAVIERIRGRLAEPDCPCRSIGSEAHRLVELRVHEHERHFWSPMLSVKVSDDEAGEGSVIDGLVGPNPSVWTLFAMVYMGLWTMVMFAGILGVVQWMLGESVWGLWVTVGLLGALGCAYAMSQVGQRLAAPQTAMLRGVLTEALELDG